MHYKPLQDCAYSTAWLSLRDLACRRQGAWPQKHSELGLNCHVQSASGQLRKQCLTAASSKESAFVRGAPKSKLDPRISCVYPAPAN